MNLKLGGIYTITSKHNGNRYVGSTTHFAKRWNEHRHQLRQNKHHSQYLQNHFNKYGEDDIVFAVVEIVNKHDLSSEQFKDLLLKIEQTYLDNWNECQFNVSKLAASSLGRKQSRATYYTYKERYKKYIVTYRVNGKTLQFGSYIVEQQAIDRVEYIKNLTQEQLDYLVNSLKEIKGYAFDKHGNRWKVSLKINNKMNYFGYYKTEQEAIDKVKEVKLNMQMTGHDPA
jgi:group I intron endonuclease